MQVGWQISKYIRVNLEKEVFYGNKLKRHAKVRVWSDASSGERLNILAFLIMEALSYLRKYLMLTPRWNLSRFSLIILTEQILLSVQKLYIISCIRRISPLW